MPHSRQGALRVVLGDQCSRDLASLLDADAASLPLLARPVPLAGLALVLVIILNTIFA